MPPIPPLNLNFTEQIAATSRSGDPFQTSAWDSSGFTVNYSSPGASGAAVAGLAIPSWVWLAGAVGAGLFLLKKYNK